MAQESVAEAPSQKRSVLPKLFIVVGVMLVIAVVVNWNDISAIAAGRKTFKSVLYGKQYYSMEPTFRFPEPMGPEDAKVRAQVIAQEGNSCHEPLVGLWMGIADLEPERLRVEFGWRPIQPTTETDGPFGETGESPNETQAPPELGCEAAVLINGTHKFEVGSGESKRVVYLTEPHPQGPPPGAGEGTGSPYGGQGWTLDDVATILNRAIEDEYGENAGLTGPAIKEAWDAATQRIPRPEPDDSEEGPSEPA
jgi:hypothetical protein